MKNIPHRERPLAGQLSAGRYDTLKRCLNHFKTFAGARCLVNKITGKVLEGYHTKLLQEVAGGWTPDYAKTYIIIAKQFIRWAYQTELLDQWPRNMQSRDLAIGVPARKLKTFTIDEVKALLSAASERTRLYLLLMMNTGMTQKDISDLHPDEVDWDKGTIERKRSKTQNAQGVPTIRYALWSDTFTLLKKYRSKDANHALLNEDAGVLKVEELRNGKLVKVDNIAVSYARLRRKLANRKTDKVKITKSLKIFRKTGPALLEDSEYASCARWFLGHAARSVADKNYIPPPQATFDKAVEWLGRKYGVIK